MGESLHQEGVHKQAANASRMTVTGRTDLIKQTDGGWGMGATPTKTFTHVYDNCESQWVPKGSKVAYRYRC